MAGERVELKPLPQPNLDDVEAAVVRQLTEQRSKTERLAAIPEVDEALLAAEMGRLGELYILYELLTPAEPAIANAWRLAPDDLRWPYLFASIAQEQRRLDEARAALDRVLELDADYLPAVIRLGEIERAADNGPAARAWYERALEIAPSSPAANWGLAQLAYGDGDSEAAVAHFEAVLDVQPGATAVHYPLGLAYRDLGEMDKAGEHLVARGEVAVQRVDPLLDGLAQYVTGASLFMMRGNQAFARGRLKIAVAAYRRAVEADPENIVAREALASALSRDGDQAGALEQLHWVIDNGHATAGTYYNLATLKSQQGDIEESYEYFLKTLELDPDLIDAHYNLGLLLERMGRPEEALVQYQRVVALDPQDTPARIRAAAVMAGQGGRREAEETLRALLVADPVNGDALLTLAEVLAAAGRNEEALAGYARLVETTEDVELEARARYGAGRLLLDAGELDTAIGELAAAVELMPRISEARLALAGALGRARRFEEAARQYDRLIGQNPGIEPAHFGRALSYLLNGQDAEAARSLGDSLALRPDAPGLRHLLARLLATSPDVSTRDGARALEMAQALFAEQQDVQYAETLAMALAEVGRFPEAIDLQSRLLTEARRVPGADLAALERRLALYRRGEPARAPWLEGG